MEENPYPNSNDPNSPKSWSELPTDLLNSVFERLSFVNFERAKSVCSSWYSSSRQCVPKKQITPWLILFPKADNSCKLFNPEEKHKLYKTLDLGLEFCRATYGNWLLIRGPLCEVCMINLFTQERIDLPSLSACVSAFCSFWIDEQTKDYIVIWGCRRLHIVYSRSGDTEWKSIPQTVGNSHMVYNDHKLFLLGSRGYIVFDFSRDVPELTVKADLIVDVPINSIHRPNRRRPDEIYCPSIRRRTKFVVTVTGDVIMVERMLTVESRTWSFSLIKVYSSYGPLNQHILVDSLGDEVMFFYQGFTLLVNDNDDEGFIRRNSIYFTDTYVKNKKELMVFDMETQKTEPLEPFDSSLAPFSRSPLWFLPSFKHVK